jgi:hypothetical protein
MANGNGKFLASDTFHQARQIMAGLVGIGVACIDRWKFPGENQGFSNNVDELVLLISLGVLAGAAGLFRTAAVLRADEPGTEAPKEVPHDKSSGTSEN